MKKFFLAVILSLVAVTSVIAEELIISIYYPPGGSADVHATAISTTLVKKGITVKREYFKSCADAVRSVSANPRNNIISGLGSDFHFSDTTVGAKCPPLNMSAVKLVPIYGIASGTMKLCTSPKFPGTSLALLEEMTKAGAQIKAGYLAGKQTLNMLTSFAASYPTINFVFLPYNGGSAQRTAIVSNDIDLFFSMTLSAEYLAKKSTTCIAATNKSTELPFMGDPKNTGKASFPEFYLNNLFLAGEGAVSESILAALKESYSTLEYNETIAKVGAVFRPLTEKEFIAETTRFETMLLK